MKRSAGRRVLAMGLIAIATVSLGCSRPGDLRITSLAPEGALVGSPGLTLVIRGERFLETTRVTFGGIEKRVTYTGPEELSIEVTAAELAAPGDIEVVVTNAEGVDPTAVDANRSVADFTVHPVERISIVEPEQTPTSGSGVPLFSTADLITLQAEAEGGGFTRDVTSTATWTSSDPSVATVVEGLVGPQAEGPVVFEATFGGLTGSLDAHVVDPTQASIEPSGLQLAVGASGQLDIVTTNGLDVNASAEWSSSAPAIAAVDGTGTPGRVTGAADGTATITAAFLGQPLTASVTVSSGGGGGGGGSAFIVVMEIMAGAEGIAVPWNGTLGSPSTFSLSGPSGGSVAFDPDGGILLSRWQSGYETFAVGPAGVTPLESVVVPDLGAFGSHRYDPLLGTFTTDAGPTSPGEVPRIDVDRASGAIAFGTAVPGLPPGAGFAHGILPVGPDEAVVARVRVNGADVSRGSLAGNGTLENVTTRSWDTGLSDPQFMTQSDNGSILGVAGGGATGGVRFFASDAAGDVIPTSPVLPTAFSLPGVKIDASGSCAFVYDLFGNSVEPHTIAADGSVASQGLTSIPGFQRFDQLLTDLGTPKIIVVGKSTGDVPVVQAVDYDSTTCSLTPSGSPVALPFGGGFMVAAWVR